MIAPRTNSSFFARQSDADLFVEEQRISKLQSHVATLARMAELVDFPAIAASVDAACPRPDRSRGGQIVDASIVTAPTTRIKDDERQAINQGDTPEGWSAKRMAHTDRDAHWTKKHGKSFYGYKLHANVDARYKLVRKFKVSAANADDGQTSGRCAGPEQHAQPRLGRPWLRQRSQPQRARRAPSGGRHRPAHPGRQGAGGGPDSRPATAPSVALGRGLSTSLPACISLAARPCARSRWRAIRRPSRLNACSTTSNGLFGWPRTIWHEGRSAAAAYRNGILRSHEAAPNPSSRTGGRNPDRTPARR